MREDIPLVKTGYLPRITNVPQLSSRKGKKLPMWAEVERFVNGYELQNYCNNPENKVEDGCILYIAITSDGLRVSFSPARTMTWFKSQRTPLKKGKRIFFSATYWLSYRNGYWQTETLLIDGDELSRSKVEQAFKIIIEDLLLDKVQLKEFCIFGCKTMGWIQYVNYGLCLICLPDNGQVMLVAQEDVANVKELTKETVMTPYNVYDIVNSTIEKL